MAVYLRGISLQLTAQDLTDIINHVNRFHQLTRDAVDYQADVTGILLSLNQILNPRGFEATITLNHTIIMVMLA